METLFSVGLEKRRVSADLARLKGGGGTAAPEEAGAGANPLLSRPPDPETASAACEREALEDTLEELRESERAVAAALEMSERKMSEHLMRRSDDAFAALEAVAAVRAAGAGDDDAGAAGSNDDCDNDDVPQAPAPQALADLRRSLLTFVACLNGEAPAALSVPVPDDLWWRLVVALETHYADSLRTALVASLEAVRQTIEAGGLVPVKVTLGDGKPRRPQFSPPVQDLPAMLEQRVSGCVRVFAEGCVPLTSSLSVALKPSAECLAAVRAQSPSGMRSKVCGSKEVVEALEGLKRTVRTVAEGVLEWAAALEGDYGGVWAESGVLDKWGSVDCEALLGRLGTDWSDRVALPGVALDVRPLRLSLSAILKEAAAQKTARRVSREASLHSEESSAREGDIGGGVGGKAFAHPYSPPSNAAERPFKNPMLANPPPELEQKWSEAQACVAAAHHKNEWDIMHSGNAARAQGDVAPLTEEEARVLDRNGLELSADAALGLASAAATETAAEPPAPPPPPQATQPTPKPKPVPESRVDDAEVRRQREAAAARAKAALEAEDAQRNVELAALRAEESRMREEQEVLRKERQRRVGSNAAEVKAAAKTPMPEPQAAAPKAAADTVPAATANANAAAEKKHADAAKCEKPATPDFVPAAAEASLRDVYKAACVAMGIKPNSGVMRILPTEPGAHVRCLNLGLNYIGVRGVLPMLEVLKHNKGLTVLDLQDNNLENGEVQALAQLLMESPGSNLTSLNLSSKCVASPFLTHSPSSGVFMC